MIKAIKRLWLSIRPPHRITQYGTCALAYFDDRSDAEKLYDAVDAFIERLERRFDRRMRSRAIWHTFFDISTGTYISSMDDIKRIEREKGYQYGSFRDIEIEAKKNDRNNLKKQKEMIRKDIAHMYREVKQGRKYTGEIQERINRGEYRTGQVQAANG